MAYFPVAKNRKFTEEILPYATTLDNAVDWIASNMVPDEVFPQNVLEQWANDNGFVDGKLLEKGD